MGNFKTGFGKSKSQTANVTPSELVFFDTADPSTGGTVFDPNTPQTTDTLYVSSVDASTWIWNGSAYVDYVAPATESTPWKLYGTNIDAGGNKTAFIERKGPIFVNSSASNGGKYAGYFYSRTTSGLGNGLIVKKDLRTTSGNYLTVQGQNFSTGVLQNKLIVTHDGNLEINGAYTLPNVDGAVNQVLTTDGAGVTTWEDAGANSGVFGIANASGVYTYYATFTLAMAGAVAGNTVEMFADVIETGSVTVVMKTGVNINGNGHTYTLNVNDASHAITCFYRTLEMFNLKVVRTGRVNNASGYAINSYSSNLKCSGVYFINTYGIAVNGGLTLHGIHAIAYGDAINHGGEGNLIYNCIGESTAGIGIHNLYSSTYNSLGKSVSGVGILSNGETYMCTGISTSNAGIAGQRVTSSTGISTSGRGIDAGIARNCTAISVSGAGGQGNFYSSYLKSTSGSAVSGPSSKLYNSYARSNGDIVAPDCHVYNSTVESFWNNAGGYLVRTTISYTREVLNSTLIVANASANCIFATASTPCNYANNVFKGSTTPVNALIIQGITNTADSQGNILV